MKLKINVAVVLFLLGFAYTGFANGFPTVRRDARTDHIVLTGLSPDTTVSAGSTVQIYGSSGTNRIIIESGAEAQFINAPGNNAVTIQSDSSLFQVSHSGAAVIFEGSDGTVLEIPATTMSQSIVFNDKTDLLVIDSNRIMLGDQMIDDWGKDTATLNYNEDGSSVRIFSDDSIAGFQKVQDKLNELIISNDKAEFNTEFDRYTDELLTGNATADTIPSYAPRGERKSLVVDVNAGSIDYSGYVLPGDLDLDSKVSFADLDALKEAMFIGDSSPEYDLNSDSKVDLKDMIFLVARIGTEIVRFDFYSTLGIKLEIPSRDVSEAPVFDYSGGQTQVMVVPKDINNASGFESGLSDIDDVWYKKTGWVHEDSEIRKNAKRVSKSSLLKATLDKVVDEEYVNSNPYLTGWSLSVKYVELGSFAELDDSGLEGAEFFLDQYKDKIVTHFNRTDMGSPLKRYLDKIKYVLQIGLRTDYTAVITDNVQIQNSYTLDGERIYVNQILHAASVIFMSSEDKHLSGRVQRENADIDGKIKLHRIGPDPEEKDYEKNVSDGRFDFDALPFGEYEVDIEDACECSSALGNNLVFTEETEVEFNLESGTADVRLKIIDKNQEPISDKHVEIRPLDCVSEDTPHNDTSDRDGIVDFENIATGKYDVYVDGKKITTLPFCSDYNGSVVVDEVKLWNFHVSYSGCYGAGEMTVKKFLIDMDNSTGGFYAFVGNDYGTYPEGTSISFSGALTYDDALSPLTIHDSFISSGKKVVEFSAIIIIDAGKPLPMQVGSMDWAMNTHSGGLLPDGAEEKFRNGERVRWTSSDPAGAPICTFTFEPYTEN
ncbi:MAG: hypothetical protein GY737_16400 [Desulfobacteraceae bacterium]|nr:hypothetical protein [Desulfobacteraceae bacterium]